MKNIRRRILFSFFTGVFFSILFYYGTKCLFAILDKRAVEYSGAEIIILIPIILLTTLLFYYLFGLRIKWKEDENFNLKRWQIFVPLALATTIVFLAFFPGHYVYDSSTMYKNFQAGEISTHFSPLITIVLSLLLSFGKMLGTEMVGHAIFVVIQFIFIDIVLTNVIYYCSKKTNRKLFGIISIIFFATNPLFQTILIRSGQDTLFGGFFTLLTLEFLKISEDENYFKDHKKLKFFYFFILIFFICAIRNNGIFALIPVFIFSFFILKNSRELRRKFYIAFIIPVITFLGYNYVFLYNFVVTEKESIYHETLNIPLIQIARAMCFNREQNFERELIPYFKADTVDDYRMNWDACNFYAGISDTYKSRLDTDEVEKDPWKFFDLWRRIGKKNVANYIEAQFIFTLGLYHPYMPYEGGLQTFIRHTYIDGYTESHDYFNTEKTNPFPITKNVVNYLVNSEGWSKIPILHLLWGGPFVFHLCIISIVFSMYRKKYKYLLPLILIFGLIITVALSPVMLYRYIFPAVMCLPIMLYIFKSMLK